MNSSKQPDSKQMDHMLQTAAGELGISADTLRCAMQNGSADALLNKLPPQDAEKLRQLLADRSAAAKIMATPQAQAILKKLFGSNSK